MTLLQQVKDLKLNRAAIEDVHWYEITPAQHAAIIAALQEKEAEAVTDEQAAEEYATEQWGTIEGANRAGFDIERKGCKEAFFAGCQHKQQQMQEKEELLEDMALFIEQVQNSKFYCAMTNEGKQLIYDLLTKYNNLPK